MKLVKSLLLGSAAGLIAVGGAQAADLPVKAKAVEYVKICSLYGAGFYYIPGTDTCIKLGGYLRAEVALNSNSVFTVVAAGVLSASNGACRTIRVPPITAGAEEFGFSSLVMSKAIVPVTDGSTICQPIDPPPCRGNWIHDPVKLAFDA